MGDLISDNSYCTYNFFQYYWNNFHSIFFSSLTQKYCFVGNIFDINNYNNRIAILYINKDIKVKNPHELKPSYPLINFLCENYSNYNINYSNNSSMIYLEKCTTEYEYIKTYSNCTFYNKTYDFLYNCSEKFPYEIVENNICVEYCNNSSFLNKTCILYNKSENKIQNDITELITLTTNLNNDNYITDESTEETIEDKLYNILIQDNYMTLPEKIKDIFLSGIINDELDSLSNGGDDITMNVDNYIFQITSTDNQRNNSNHNISTINLGECETILKNEYHIDKNKPLLILKIDTIVEGSKIPDIQYKVYHPDKKKPLNLSLCDETKIEINIPVSIDEENIYKYNTSSDYYNNKCNVTDIPLKYRREEFINKNMTLCEADCNYLGYDKETKNSKCKCPIKTEMDLFNLAIDTDLLKNNFVNISNINIDIIKCYYLLFDKYYLIYNIGNYILLFIILLFAVGSFLFCFKGSYLLNRKINTLLLQTNLNRINKRSFNNNNLVTSTSITKNVNKKNKNMKIIKNDKKNKVKNNCYPPIKKDVRKNLRTINKKKNELNEPNSSYQKIEFKNNIKLEINRKIQIKCNKKTKQNNKNKYKNLNKKTNNIELKHKSIMNNINYRLKLNDYEINRLNYKEAVLIDKRTYFQYYWSLLRMGHLFIFSFIPNNDYNIIIIKICLFFFSFALYYTVNALFFTDETTNKIYKENGYYDFIYEIPKILYSNLICTVINLIVKTLSLSEKDILKIKSIKKGKNFDKKVEEIRKYVYIKFILFFIISFIFLFIFWFYLSCFCAVYHNTQIHLIKDTLISFSLSLLYPFGYYLIPGILRIPALRSKKKNKECIYKFSILIQFL